MMKSLIIKLRGSSGRAWLKRFLMLASFILFEGGNVFAQDIPVLTFNSFQKYLNPTSDTVYVINFWATWCKPCVEELPSFEKLNQTYKDKKVKVLLVSLDFKNQYEEKLVPFVQRNKMQSQVMLLDNEGNNDFIDRVSASWQGTIPATMIIQASSKTKKFYEHQFTFGELENMVKPLIKL